MTDSTELPIAIDAMGGDNAPGDIVRGTLLAVAAYGCNVALVGRRVEIERELNDAAGAKPTLRDRITIVDATEVVGMDEHPANAVRAKKDSSVVRACQMAANGEASAAVSAGNSGAMLAASLFAFKRIDGVARPAIGAMFPTRRGRTFVLDVGANTDCKAEWLAQFAVMGSVYAQKMMGIASPTVSLLSNGEEAEKGSALVQEAHPLLMAAPIRFIGNVEGKEVFAGAAHVVVCDGFVGNIALKVAEGVGDYLFATMKDEAMTSLSGKLGGALLRGKLRGIRDRVDYRHTGGALLLGVRGEAIIAHGRSDAIAIKNAIRVAREAVAADVSGTIAGALSAMNNQQPAAAAATT